MNYIYQGSNNPYLQEKKHKNLLSKNYGTFPEYITNFKNFKNLDNQNNSYSNKLDNINKDIQNSDLNNNDNLKK